MSFQLQLQSDPILQALSGYLTGYSQQAQQEAAQRRARQSNHAGLIGVGAGAGIGAIAGAALAPFTGGLSLLTAGLPLLAAGTGAALGAGIGGGIGAAYETNPQQARGAAAIANAAGEAGGLGLAYGAEFSPQQIAGVYAGSLLHTNAFNNIALQNQSQAFHAAQTDKYLKERFDQDYLNHFGGTPEQGEQVGERALSGIVPSSFVGPPSMEQRVGHFTAAQALAPFNLTPEQFGNLPADQQKSYTQIVGGNLMREQMLGQRATIQAGIQESQREAERFAKFEDGLRSGAVQITDTGLAEKYNNAKGLLASSHIALDGTPLPLDISEPQQKQTVQTLHNLARRAWATGDYSATTPPPINTPQDLAKAHGGIFVPHKDNPDAGEIILFDGKNVPHSFTIGPKGDAQAANKDAALLGKLTDGYRDLYVKEYPGDRPLPEGKSLEIDERARTAAATQFREITGRNAVGANDWIGKTVTDIFGNVDPSSLPQQPNPARPLPQPLYGPSASAPPSAAPPSASSLFSPPSFQLLNAPSFPSDPAAFEVGKIYSFEGKAYRYIGVDASGKRGLDQVQ